MFFGETAINLDAKGRLAIPIRYRDSIQELCEGRLVDRPTEGAQEAGR